MSALNARAKAIHEYTTLREEAGDEPLRIAKKANVIESALVFCEGEFVEVRHLPPELLGHTPPDEEDGDGGGGERRPGTASGEIRQGSPPMVFPVGTPIERTASVVEEIEERDRRDIERENAPLAMADDALYLDSSNMPIDQVVEEVLGLIR